MTDAPSMPVPPPDPGPRGRLALAVAAAVDSVPGVRRSRGAGVEVATQYPGGRAIGVVLGEGTVEIHVIAERPQVALVAAAVHAAAQQVLDALGDGRPAAVVVDDLDVASLSAGGV